MHELIFRRDVTRRQYNIPVESYAPRTSHKIQIPLATSLLINLKFSQFTWKMLMRAEKDPVSKDVISPLDIERLMSVVWQGRDLFSYSFNLLADQLEVTNNETRWRLWKWILEDWTGNIDNRILTKVRTYFEVGYWTILHLVNKFGFINQWSN